MSDDISIVLTGRAYLECPRWHDDRIWVSDFYRHEVVSATEDGRDVRVEAEVPQQPSGLGWLPDGRLLIVSMRDRTLLRRETDGELVVHADLADHVDGHPNDMVVDAQGRAYLGNFGFDLMGGADIAPSGLLRVDPDGSITHVAEDLWFANGSVITDYGVLIVDETFGNR
ncbi:MAG: SMP-30/gluconolactonase/LRE family protein, partial [Trebonia sp.]